MAEMMQAITSNNTTINFRIGDMCNKYNCLFNLKNIPNCNVLQGLDKILKYAMMLRDKPFTSGTRMSSYRQSAHMDWW